VQCNAKRWNAMQLRRLEWHSNYNNLMTASCFEASQPSINAIVLNIDTRVEINPQ